MQLNTKTFKQRLLAALVLAGLLVSIGGLTTLRPEPPTRVACYDCLRTDGYIWGP